MSASPTRYQATPSPSQEIRSQAIAKLKRAASLPRTPDGRRPPLIIPGRRGGLGSSTTTSEEGHGGAGGSSASGHSQSSTAPTPSPSRLQYDYDEEEHLLGGPEVNVMMDSTGMQRTLSDSSSFHIPTPPHMPYGSSHTSPFVTAQTSPVNPGSDWPSAPYNAIPMQHPQPFLAGLSPPSGSAPPSAFPQGLHTTGPGRNTPSPLLPTLTDLRNLSRSNSAAARAKAMCKLTGQPETPTRSTNIPTPMSSDEDVRFGFHGLPGSRLTRSGTIGVPRIFGITPSPQPVTTDDTAAPTMNINPAAAPIPDTAFDVPRPRLQRSFTVSSSNMGEERRSAVGRRMVERLAERRAARQQEEGQVRKLWEERRREAELRKSTDTWSSRHKSLGQPVAHPAEEEAKGEDEMEAEEQEEQAEQYDDDQYDQEQYDGPYAGMEDGGEDEHPGPATPVAEDRDWNDNEDGQEDDVEEPEDDMPTAQPSSSFTLPPIPHSASLLAASYSDRTPSRNTERSDEFEYESHLRRSLSSRTARNELLDINPEVALPSPLIEDAAEGANNEGVFLRQQQRSASTTGLSYTDHSSHGHSSHGHSSHGHSSHGHGSHDHSNQSSHGHHSNEDAVLPLPVLPFSGGTRHTNQESFSSSATVMPAGRSPGVEPITHVEAAPNGSPAPSPRFPSNGVDNGWQALTSHSSQNSLAEQPHIAAPFNAYKAHDHTDNERDSSSHAQQNSIHSVASVTSMQERSISRMSWDEIGPEDAMPSKKGSLSGKKGRAMLSALRKHSAADKIASPPASPRHAFAQVFGRRESESSASPGQRSARESPVNARSIKHEASSSSISQQAATQEAASANNLLIQHQLSNSPSPVSFLPRADIKDPRIMNSKLSPFPGISVAAPSRSRSGSESHQEMPRVIANGAAHGQRGSEDNSSGGSGRRGWLSSKAMPASRSSGATSASDNHSRQGSSSSHLSQPSFSHSHGQASSIGHGSQSSIGQVNQTSMGHGHQNSIEHSEYLNGTGSSNGHDSPRAVKSPTESITPRDRTRGNKTRADIPSFMMNRRRAPPPPIELGSSNVVSINDDAAKANNITASKTNNAFDTLPKRSLDVLTRMDSMLSLSSNDPARPDFLDDPPRKLLLSQQVLQVVNVHTVKDRYLFLFNDIMVIAKPMITHGVQATLDMKFVVKSVVSLDKLTVSGIADEPTKEPPRHPAVTSFIRQFSEDAHSAVQQLADRSALKLDSSTLASLLFKTPELDKSQLGLLLASDQTLLRAFMERFHFDQVRIDDALRMFLLAIRLPTDIAAAEALLRGFADGFHWANQNYVPYDHVRARDLVLATLELNDMLYSTFGFAFPNHAISADTFVSAFRSKDPNWLVPDSLLDEIYASIRSSKLVQALAPHEAHLARDISITPARLPPKLSFNQWSDPITITLPRPDPNFRLKLLGEGLEFDSPVLDFAHSNQASFRVRGVSLGAKSILFERTGPNAAYYASIGNTRTFTVERNFMRHTFHVQFMSHLGTRRKYCFSVPDAASRQKWATMLQRQVWLTTEKRTGAGAPTTVEQRVRRATEAVSLQVLRDALIPSERGTDTDGTPHASRKPSANRPDPHLQRMNRMGSVSVAYASKAAAEEFSLGPLQPTKGQTNERERQSGLVQLQTGKELVLLCRQNSLLPTVLELLQTGAEPSPAPVQTQTMSRHGSSTSVGHIPLAHSTSHPSANAPPHPAQHAHSHSIPQSAGMAGVQPQRSAGLKALMHDRRL